MVGSEDSRWGRFVSAGAGEDELGFAVEAVGIDNFQFPYEAAWLGAFQTC